MNDMFIAAKEVCDFMQECQWGFCIIGGLAVIRWGEPRLTQDADLTLLTGVGDEEAFARTLLKKFQGRLKDTLEFAMTNRVLLIRASNGVQVDISFGALDYEIEMIRRASIFEYEPGVELPTCSADDLFIMKAFAGRPRDWMDIEGLMVRQGDMLDRVYILKHLVPLCEIKEAPETVDRVRHILGVA